MKLMKLKKLKKFGSLEVKEVKEVITRFARWKLRRMSCWLEVKTILLWTFAIVLTS